jgi:hypothetical protein
MEVSEMAVQNGQFKHWSEKQCNEIIAEHKDSTQYFNEQMTFDEAKELLKMTENLTSV